MKVWSGISLTAHIDLVTLREGNLNTGMYIRARMISQYLNDGEIQVLDWPPRCPDLILVEHTYVRETRNKS